MNHTHICVICNEEFRCSIKDCQIEPQYAVCEGQSCIDSWENLGKEIYGDNG